MKSSVYIDAPAATDAPRVLIADELDGLALADEVAHALTTLRREGAVVAVTTGGRTTRRVYEGGEWRYR